MQSAFRSLQSLVQTPIDQAFHPRVLLYLVPPPPSRSTVAIVTAVFLLIISRIYLVIPGPSRTCKSTATKHHDIKVAVYLGSGGHTSELLQLLTALPTQTYSQRVYLYSSEDNLSLQKAQTLEQKLNGSKGEETPFESIQIPRARGVHQSLVSTPFTLATSILFCLNRIVRPALYQKLVMGKRTNLPRCQFADLVLMNGPGTCVPIVFAIYVLKFLGLPSPKMIYIESFARVKSLSLTAKMIRPFVDCFVVQWPTAAASCDSNKDKTMYRGWLV